MAESAVQSNGSASKEQQISSGDEASCLTETDIRLEFSGMSEDELIGHSAPMGVDMDTHSSAPAPTAFAVKRPNIENEFGFSDDDTPKTLTTLEPMKKAKANDIAPNEDEEMVDEHDGHEEGTILLEVYTNDDDRATPDNEIAASQSNHRGAEKSKKTGRKEKHIISTPGANISFDMPSELLVSTKKKSPVKLANDELIAILEGDDPIGVDAATYEVHIVNDDVPTDNRTGLSKEQERAIALEQILNLPRKKKGRPPKPAHEKNTKKTAPSKLVKSLVSDWNDDGDSSKPDEDDQNETEILVEINDNGEAEISAAVPVVNSKRTVSESSNDVAPTTFRRSRIIKKKIIWDPDAPETCTSYASLVHTSGPGAKRKVSAPKKTVAAAVSTESVDAVAHTAIGKKKKTSELEKLLGDEGAVNMLNSLHSQENGNGVSASKSSRLKTIKTELVEEPAVVATASAKSKSTRKETTKEPSPQKQSGATKKVTSPNAGGKKRGPKPAAASWDYVYSSRPDDCMIVRRRSNSSYSSSASVNRNSIELPSAPSITDDDEPPKKKTKAEKVKLFEFTKPTPKSPVRRDDDPSGSAVIHRRKRGAVDTKELVPSIILTKLQNEQNNGVAKKSAAAASTAVSGTKPDNEFTATDYNEIVVKKYETFAHILLKPHSAADDEMLLTAQMMKEVESHLQTLDSDKTCKLILITSSNRTFCNGIDCSTLLQATTDKRRAAAQDLSKKLT